eukprot:8781596-Alexandrium_andersonii.AAC.1
MAGLNTCHDRRSETALQHAGTEGSAGSPPDEWTARAQCAQSRKPCATTLLHAKVPSANSDGDLQ